MSIPNFLERSRLKQSAARYGCKQEIFELEIGENIPCH